MNTENVCDVEVDGIDTTDYPDFCDAFVSSATWRSTGVPLNDAELDELNDLHHEFVYESVINYLH